MSSLENHSDSDLLELVCIQGENAALALLAKRYGPLVFGIAFGYTRDLQVARMVTDRVFRKLARDAIAIRGRVELGYWLRHAAADECDPDMQKPG